MKSLIVVFGALMLIIALPVLFLSSHNARVESYDETFAGVTTGAGVYSANVTLGQSVFDNVLISITGISSNVSADAPSAAYYNSVSRLTTINGLDESTTRTLSLIYDIDSTIIPSGASVFFNISGWFFLFSIIGLIAGAIYAFWD